MNLLLVSITEISLTKVLLPSYFIQQMQGKHVSIAPIVCSIRYSLLEMASELVHHCGSKLVAITNGEQPSILANKNMVRNVHIIGPYHILLYAQMS